MSRVEQPNRPHELDDPIRKPQRPTRAASRSQRRANVRAHLAKAKEHLQRNALFALTADQLDQLALQQAQWEATAYAAAAEILNRAQPTAITPPTDAGPDATPGAPSRPPSYSGRHHADSVYGDAQPPRPRPIDQPIPLDTVRPQLWPIVTALIAQHHGDKDLEAYYGRLHLTFSWLEQNREHMPQAEAEIPEWLREHCHVLWEDAGPSRSKVDSLCRLSRQSPLRVAPWPEGT